MKRRTLTFLAMSRSLQASWAFLSVSAMRCVNSSLRDCTLELSSFRLIISLQNIFTHLTLSPSVDQSNSHYCSFPNDTGNNTRYGWIPSPAFNSIDLKWGFFFKKKHKSWNQQPANIVHWRHIHRPWSALKRRSLRKFWQTAHNTIHFYKADQSVHFCKTLMKGSPLQES